MSVAPPKCPLDFCVRATELARGGVHSMLPNTRQRRYEDRGVGRLSSGSAQALAVPEL